MNTKSVINIASVPHRSPFRYPGGKTWLVPHIRKWLASLSRKPNEFVEAFAGGAIVGLSVVFEDLVETSTLIELDKSVAAVWRTILSGRVAEFADRIEKFQVSMESVREILDAKPRSLFDKAFATIIRNRMNRGGILAPGASLMKNGENGKGLLSRWYPVTLKRRILDIASHAHRLRFIQGDGMEYLISITGRRDVATLIDPPYTVAGRRLYSHSEVDHYGLFKVASFLKGDFLMTYDDTPQVRDLAEKFGLDMQTVAMKNTHHAVMSELLIGRDLSWSRS